LPSPRSLLSPFPLVLSYLAIVFGFSFIGFVAQQPTVHFHEYSLPDAIVEVGGHFAFGTLVGLPFRQSKAALATGAFAVAIDADHILGALNLNVSSRPDHSPAFALGGMLLLWILVRRYPRLSIRGGALATASLVPISVLSHYSYDILAAGPLFHGLGSSFPVFVPFSFALVPFPTWSWVLFEAAGFSLALLVSRLIPSADPRTAAASRSNP